MKKYDVPAVLLTALILICLFALPELIGQRRPLPSEEQINRQELADSSMKKADTTVTNQLQAEVDSTQDSLDTRMPKSGFLKEGSNITITEHGSPPDSATIASSGGGGAWNPADSTLSLRLPEYFTWSVLPFENASRDDSTADSNWADDRWDGSGTGTHQHNTTNCLVGLQGTQLTGDDVYAGIHLDFRNTDFTHFANGDTSTTADIIRYSVFIGTQDIADMGDANGFAIVFTCDAKPGFTNYFYKTHDDSEFGNGWNHFKTTKSGFGSANSPNWNAVTGVTIYLSAAPDAEVILTVDHIAMIRAIGGEPNPYQSEGPNGTWTADWTQEGNGNILLVEEFGRLGIISADGASSHLRSAAAFSDFSLSGTLRYGNSTAGSYLPTLNGHTNSLLNGASGIVLYDSTGASHTMATSFVSGEELYFRYNRKETSHTLSLSKDGIAFPFAVSTFCFSGVRKVNIVSHDPTQGAPKGQRYYSAGLSNIAHANMSRVAQSLLGWHFEIVGDSLQITHGDSVYNSVIDSRRAK